MHTSSALPLPSPCRFSRGHQRPSARQRLQHLPLRPLSAIGGAVELGEAAVEIEDQRPKASLAGYAAAAPLHCAHARTWSLASLEGLHQVVVGAEVEAVDAVVERVARRSRSPGTRWPRLRMRRTSS